MTNPNRVMSIVSGAGVPLATGRNYIDSAIAIANGVGTQWLAMSTWVDSSGNFVDPTGTTDSWAAFSSAVAYCAQQIAAGTPIAIWVDCPMRISIGTNAAKTIFLGNSMTIRCQPGVGYFITDCVMLHLFDIINMLDVTFIDLDILYVGTFGVTASDQQNPNNAYNGTISTYNDTYGKGFMAAPSIGGVQQWAPITFSSGGSYAFPSATNACALISICGNSDRISFLGKTKMRVPDGAPACNFIPFCINVFPNWAPGISRSGNPPTTNTNGGVAPGHVYIESALFDGYLMGICGTVTWIDARVRGLRYSDMQDANGNNIGGTCFSQFTLASAPTAGATSITLNAAWANAGSTQAITFSNGTTINGTFANGSATVSLASALPAGTYTTAIGAAFSQNWFAPPHLIYLHSLDFTFSFPMSAHLDVFDEGVYVGSPNTRNTGSGYIDTMKIEPANGTVTNCVSLRPHGGMDFLAFNNSNGKVKMYSQLNTAVYQQQQITFTAALSSATSGTLNAPWRYTSGTYSATFSNGSTQNVTVVYGLTTCTWGTAVTATATASLVNTSQLAGFACRFPSSPPILNVSLDIEYIDTAPVPVGFPIQGDGQFGNTGVTIKSYGIVQDWPVNATYVPGFSMGGQNINIDSTIIFINCSSTAQYIGSAENTGSTLAVQSSFKYTVIGWRTTQLLFTGGTISGTSATLSAPFPYTTGSYELGFSDGENRYASFTNGSTAVSWTTALTNTVTNVGALSLMNGSNWAPMSNRIINSQGGLSYGNRIELIDSTNTYYALVENNQQKIRFVQDFQGVITGATYTVPIILPSGFSIDSWALRTTAALTGSGVTGLNVGTTTGTATQINNGGGNTVAIGTAVNNPTIPAHTPIAFTGTPSVLLTAIGGTLTGGTINMAVSVAGTTMCG
jgi:hypothetical protein